LGDWIDACWVKAHEILNAGEIMTVEELIAEMPIYGNSQLDWKVELVGTV